MRRLLTFLAVTVLALAAQAAPKIETLAGTGVKGFSGDNGPAQKALLNNPYGLTRGPDGALYVCDTDNHAIRRIDKDNTITTIAGVPAKKGYAGDGGPAVKALLNEPYELRFDMSGDLFIVERANHCIRKLDMKTGAISTIAGNGKPGFAGDDGPASKAQFNQPHSIQFDTGGSYLYVCDILNHRVRRIFMQDLTIQTYGGTGEKGPTRDGARVGATPLFGPRAIDFDAAGNLWLALREGNTVYRVDTKDRTIEHVAGTGKKGFTGNGGPAKLATLSGPKGLAIDPTTGNVYLADTESHSIRMINAKTNTIELIAGAGQKGDGPDGDPLTCKLSRPHGVYVDNDGTLYIGDSDSHRIRAIRK